MMNARGLAEVLGEIDWEAGPLVHNWRRHVGERTRRFWTSFSNGQKIAIALDADEKVMAEERE